MKRPIRRAAILLVIGFVVLVWIWWAWSSGSRNRSPQQPTIAATVNQAITHPVAFAENHFKGGIGAMLTMDPQTGLPTVGAVINGSPAQKAGMTNGDVIAKINGTPTTGQSLAKIVDELRGLAGGQVTVTVQRAGSTNLEMTLRRSSWSGLGINYAPTPSNGPALVIPVAPVPAPASNNPPK